MKTLISNVAISFIFIFLLNKIASAAPINAFIDNVTPPQNAINVNKSSNIDIVFVQAMNASTINSSNIKVFGLQTGILTTSISYNAGTKTATINPSNDFKVGEKISITLTSGIKTGTNAAILQLLSHLLLSH